MGGRANAYGEFGVLLAGYGFKSTQPWLIGTAISGPRPATSHYATRQPGNTRAWDLVVSGGPVGEGAGDGGGPAGDLQ